MENPTYDVHANDAASEASATQFNIDRTYPGRWTISFNNPPINMFVPTTIVELGALMTDITAGCPTHRALCDEWALCLTPIFSRSHRADLAHTFAKRRECEGRPAHFGPNTAQLMGPGQSFAWLPQVL